MSFVLLFALFAGVFQFGYTMYIYNGLATAAAQGARLAARSTFTAPGTTFVQSVKNMVVFGSPSGGTVPLVPGLTTANVEVTWTADAAGVPESVTVSIRNYSINAVFTNYTFDAKPKATMRYEGRYRTPS